MKNFSLYVASVIFLFVSIAHFVRFFLKVAIVIGSHTIPLEASLYGGIVSIILAVWMFIAAKVNRRISVGPTSV